MGKAQLEDGYTRIANELCEALARLWLSPHESQLLWLVLRLTYGWHREKVSLTLEQIATRTGMDTRRVCEARASLQARKILVVEKIPFSRNLSLNNSPPIDYVEGSQIPGKRNLAVTPSGASRNEIPGKRNDNIPVSRNLALSYSLQRDYSQWEGQQRKNTIPGKRNKSYRFPGMKRRIKPSAAMTSLPPKDIKTKDTSMYSTLDESSVPSLEGTQAFAAHYENVKKDSLEYKTAIRFWEKVKPYLASQADPDFRAWAIPIKHMLEVKKIGADYLIEVLSWALTFRSKDGFTWAGKVLNPVEFEKHVDRISGDMKGLQDNKPTGAAESMEDIVARVVAREEARDAKNNK